MPGQVIESSFSPRVSEPFAQTTADAFGRAQSLQQNLQIEQARNQLTQQSINIDAARQQTTAQLYQAEAAASNARTELLQKMMPGQLKMQDLDLQAQQALAAGRSVYSPEQMAADSKAMAQANLKMMGSQSDKTGVEAAFAAQQIQENLKNMEAVRAHTTAQTAQLNQQQKDQDEKIRQDRGMQLAQMAMMPGADPEIFKKQKAVLGSGTMADFISPDQIGSTDPQKIYETAAANAMKDPGHPAFGAAMTLQGQIAASRNGLVAPPRDNPLAAIAGKTQSNPGQDAVTGFASALQAMRDKQGAGVANSGGTTTGESSAGAGGEDFFFKPTGNVGVDRGLGQIQDFSKGNKTLLQKPMDSLSPVQQQRSSSVLKGDVGLTVGADGKMTTNEYTRNYLRNQYSPAEVQSIQSALVTDPKATVQQQAVYNKLISHLIFTLNGPNGGKDADAVASKTFQMLSQTQQSRLKSLIEDFK